MPIIFLKRLQNLFYIFSELCKYNFLMFFD